jgi:hypothetical protein
MILNIAVLIDAQHAFEKYRRENIQTKTCRYRRRFPFVYDRSVRVCLHLP